MEFISQCPLCASSQFVPFLDSKDYFLSKENFSIVSCTHCGFRFTNPRPGREEIIKYYESTDYISHDSIQKNFLAFLYRKVRNLAIKKKIKLIKKYTNGPNILDIGCGTGEFLKACAENGFHAHGIEPNDKARTFAKNNHKLDVGTEEDIKNLKNNSYDLITMWHVLEHVHDLAGRMTQLRYLIKDSGVVIIAIPNSNSHDAEIYKEYWAAYDLPRHISHFTKESMNYLAEKNGFLIREIFPLKLDAYYISLLSEKNKNGKQNYFRAAYFGMKSNYYARKNKNNYSSLIFVLKCAKNAI
jgi:2-polyprenyl-3-methyl-5-hydroxy-6-metoxy-1,4-benzoquinol methylase